MPRNSSYSHERRIIEIADILFSSPTKEVSVIVSDIVCKCQKSERTVWRWIKKAQEYNSSRLKTTEKAKNDLLVEKAKESIKRDILSREEAEEILSGIAKKKAVKVGDTVMVPTSSEQVRAIDKLAELNGWDAPVKTAQTDTQGNDMERAEIKVTVIQTPFKLAGNEDELDV